VLSIQSHVVYGHAGNSAAVFPMRRLGVNVWPLNTVQFSNHTQYEAGFKGMVIPADQVPQVVSGISAIGELDKCDAVLSGYIGSAEQGALVLDAVQSIREANPDCIYCCDPVMGMPEKGCIVPQDVTDFLASSACTTANIISPNIMELEKITNRKISSVAEAVAACRWCLDTSPQLQLCLVKHLSYAGIDKGASFEMLLVGEETGDSWHISTPLLPFGPKAPVGVGDFTSGVFLANVLKGDKTPVECFEHTAASYFEVLQATLQLKSYELQVCSILKCNQFAMSDILSELRVKHIFLCTC
jgi:pyridoxine kinase